MSDASLPNLIINLANLILPESMAASITIAPTSSTLYYHSRITWLVVLSCFMAATGGFLFGYDTGITGGVTSMEAFLKKFFPGINEESEKTSNYCKFNSMLLTSFTASIYLSGLFATFVASHVTQAYGRKASIMLGGVTFLAGAAVGGAAENIYMLLLGRLLLGLGLGFSNQSVPLYLSEMAPPNYRGALNISFQIFLGSGNLAAFLINCATDTIAGDLGWRISLGAAVLPALILTIGVLFLPETPNSLLERSHDPDKAERLLQRIRGSEDVHAELADLVSASRNAAAIKKPFKRILDREYRPHLVMSVAIPFFQQMTGINVITFYSPILFRTIGYGESASLTSTVVMSVVGLVTSVISSLIVDKFGRRAMFHIGGVVMFITQMAIGGIFVAKLGDYGVVSKGYGNVLLSLMSIYVAGVGISWAPLGWLVSSEIYPLEIRSAAQSITVGVGFFTTFLIGQTFLAMLCWMKAGIFFFYGAWVSVMTVFVWWLLPETKNIPIEKMHVVWQKHGFWKRFMCTNTQEYGRDQIQEPLLH